MMLSIFFVGYPKSRSKPSWAFMDGNRAAVPGDRIKLGFGRSAIPSADTPRRRSPDPSAGGATRIPSSGSLSQRACLSAKLFAMGRIFGPTA
jgi:hypothetical protein